MTGETGMNGYPMRAPHAAWRVVDGEAVVVSPATNEVHVLNRTATAAWRLFDGLRTAEDAARELADSLELSLGDVLPDVERLVGELELRGLLARLEAPAALPAWTGPASRLVGGYVAPKVESTEPLEVVAAICASTREGQGGGNPNKPPKPGRCRVFGVCQKPFE
jgi:hypothetical protein